MFCGWDLGGAHIKCVVLDASGGVLAAEQQPCRLWLGLGELESALRKSNGRTTPGLAHAVTMTGELVDLFPSRAAGVGAILDTFAQAIGQARVFTGDALVDGASAKARWVDVASANWRATAMLCAELVGDALILDIGSTTTDITLVGNGRVLTALGDDHARLRTESLVYSGVVRTPLMAVARHAPFAGEWVGLMAEYFATSADVYRILGRLDATFDQADTADGQGKSVHESTRRLARMVGTDVERVPRRAWERLAAWFAREQVAQLCRACERQLSRDLVHDDAPVIGLGIGSFVAEQIARSLGRPYRDFAAIAGITAACRRAVDVCGPAYALAELARRARV